MIADAAMPGAGWASVVAALVFLGALAVLAVDRTRLKGRLAALERSEALRETDLADARREIESLRDCLRDRTPAAAGEVGTTRIAPGDPSASVS